MRFLIGLGRFWYDFVIGDDWKIAAAVVSVLIIGGVLVVNGVTGALLAPLLAIGVALTFVLAMVIDVRRN